MRTKFLITILGVWLLGVPLSAQTQYVLTTAPSSVQDVCTRHGLTPVAPVWIGSSSGVYLVSSSAAPADVEAEVAADSSVLTFEPNQSTRLSELAGAQSATLTQSTSGILDTLPTRTLVNFFGSTVPSNYLQQPATAILRVNDARSATGLTGVATVAVIDTGVDPNHPALATSLVPGYDFTRNLGGIPSEFADLSPAGAAFLTQSTSGILDSNNLVMVNGFAVAILAQSTSGILDQSTSGILDTSSLPRAFGHGTMTSGLVHLIAPTAKIMPLKAFSADGTGQISNIISAIYYAADHGASVISMSFEMPAQSPGLRAAMGYAQNKGAILVAASGNDASTAAVWPAALSNVLSIGSTSNLDAKSSFSNFGSPDVVFAAPGEGVITTYPGGNYAAGWGTSFSAPMVAGASTLILQRNPQGGFSFVTGALDKSVLQVPMMGRGRVDLYKALMSISSSTSTSSTTTSNTSGSTSGGSF